MIKTSFDKPHLTVTDQIELLKKRGMKFIDEQKAIQYLSNISYYRLKTYSHYFLELNPTIEEQFKDGTTFEMVFNLYLFDRELRLLVFDMIERLEIAFRTQISYHYSLMDKERWWFNNETNFKDLKVFENTIENIEKSLRGSRDSFIVDYFKYYNDPLLPPSWMTFEVITFGTISKIFSNLKTSKQKNDITRYFNLFDHEILESWIHSMMYVRNICAHHGRLWNRLLIIQPQIPKKTPQTWLNFVPPRIKGPDKIYIFLCSMLYLMKKVNPTNTFVAQFTKLINLHEINLASMGFPENWKDEPLWQI